MANNIRNMADPFDAGSRNRRPSKVLSQYSRVEIQPCEGSSEYRAMLDEGLLLNRAFFNIRSASVRRAIIKLIIEAARRESADDPLFPSLN